MISFILSIILLIILLAVSTNIMLGSFVIYTLNIDPTLNILCLVLVLSDTPLVLYAMTTLLYTVKLFYLKRRSK